MCILCCNRLKIIWYFDQNLEVLSDPEISAGDLCMVNDHPVCIYTYPFPPYEERVNGIRER